MQDTLEEALNVKKFKDYSRSGYRIGISTEQYKISFYHISLFTTFVNCMSKKQNIVCMIGNLAKALAVNSSLTVLNLNVKLLNNTPS